MRAERNSHAKVVAAFALAALLVAERAQAESGEWPARWAPVAFDAVVLRPFSAVATLVGAVLFVPAAVLTSPGGRPAITEAWNTFVAAPAEEAFKRPLGDF